MSVLSGETTYPRQLMSDVAVSSNYQETLYPGMHFVVEFNHMEFLLVLISVILEVNQADADAQTGVLSWALNSTVYHS